MCFVRSDFVGSIHKKFCLVVKRRILDTFQRPLKPLEALVLCTAHIVRNKNPFPILFAFHWLLIKLTCDGIAIKALFSFVLAAARGDSCF